MGPDPSVTAHYWVAPGHAMVSCWALGVTGASAILLVSGANSGPFGVWDCVQRGQKGSGGPQLLQPVARRGCIFAWLAAWPGGSQD